MQNPLKRIIAAFVLIALLPVGFLVYELSSLNKNEAIVREIYRNQLDAILYSVNQYSDDIISSWANRVRLELRDGNGVDRDTVLTSRIRAVVAQLQAVQYIYFSDLEGRSSIVGPSESDSLKPELRAMTDKIVKLNRDRVQKLITYERAGFRKMEAMDTILANGMVPIFFVTGEGQEPKGVSVMLVDLNAFIVNILGPKMQLIAEDKFVISAFQQGSDATIYTTGEANPGNEARARETGKSLRDNTQRKEFWLLPGYYLGISLNGATIDDLVADRLNTSMFILSLLLLMLVAGIVFLYRNIRREVHLSQAKSEFVSNVSHEIRTPLSLISMYAETLEMDRVPEARKKEYYNVISKETARLSRIVNRILNFSRLEASKKIYEFKPVDLNQVCAEVIDSCSFQLKDKGFSWELVKDPLLENIRGDYESLTEAVVNLVDNGIKYSLEKKHILVRTGSEGEFQFVEVTDEGIGIPKNYQHEIFEKFFRAPTGDVHNTKGSGLGLTFVKKTVEAHRGKIKVVSAPGKGSTFRLYFPKKTERRYES